MKHFALIGLIILTIGCQRQSKIVVNMGSDTLMINNKVFYIDSISEITYNSTVDKELIGSQVIEADTSKIIINQDSITIIAENDSMIVYKNDTSDGESRVIFEYVNTIKQYDLVHIKGIYWEWTVDYLITLKNGKETALWEAPMFSPNGQYIICSSADLEAMEMNNGIQLFKNKQGNIEIIFEKLIENWEPEEIKWESDSVILIKRAKLDNNYNKHFDYLKMRII
jgi:hypothetical protein